MKIAFLILVFGLFVFTDVAHACSCAPVPLVDRRSEEYRKQRREYFLSEFKGAAFIGEIIKRERVSFRNNSVNGSFAGQQFFKYTIRVSEHWFGVTSKTVVVYGEPNLSHYTYTARKGRVRTSTGSSCGFTLSVKKKYFFVPKLTDGRLLIDLCDDAGGGSQPGSSSESEFRATMGEPTRQ